jgi:hypothetical protein
MDGSELAFVIVGGVGFLLLLLRLVLGDLLDFGDVDTDVGPEWFNMQVICASLVGLGVFGFVAESYDLPATASWPVAAAGFFSVGAGVYFGVVRPMKRQQSNSLITRDSYQGAVARVTLTIPAKGIGQVAMYNSNGVYVTHRAESNEDVELPAGSSVLIHHVDKDRVHVSPAPNYLLPEE